MNDPALDNGRAGHTVVMDRYNYGDVIMSRHNGDVSNHQPHDCLLNRLFTRWSKKTSKFRVTGLCVGNSPVTGEFPAQNASNAEIFLHLMTSSYVTTGLFYKQIIAKPASGLRHWLYPLQIMGCNLVIGPWEIWTRFKKIHFQSCLLIGDKYPHVNATELHLVLVDTGSNNGLIQLSNNSLPVPMLTQFY